MNDSSDTAAPKQNTNFHVGLVAATIILITLGSFGAIGRGALMMASGDPIGWALFATGVIVLICGMAQLVFYASEEPREGSFSTPKVQGE